MRGYCTLVYTVQCTRTKLVDSLDECTSTIKYIQVENGYVQIYDSSKLLVRLLRV